MRWHKTGGLSFLIMLLTPPDPSLFDIANVVADAIALANMVLDYWLVVVGMGLGTAIMLMVYRQFRKAIPR